MDAITTSTAAALIALMLGYLIKVSTDTRSDVRLINGRLSRLEERVTGETKLGDEREHRADDRMKQLERH